jgi:cytochrome c biogenesis protein
MKFAIWVLVLAAVLSLLSLLAGELLPPSSKETALFRILGLADPFRSWWFQATLGVLALSLLVCVIERAPLLFRQAFMVNFRTNSAQFPGLPNYVQIQARDGEASATRLMKRFGLKVRRVDENGTVALFGSAGGISRLGPLLNHFGMLLLIIGGMVVALTTEKESVLGIPGEAVTRPEWGFTLRIDDFRILYYPVGLNMWVETPEGRRGKVEQIKGDSARVSFGVTPDRRNTRWLPISTLTTGFEIPGDNGGMMPFQGNIKSYVSSVTLIKEGKELYKKEIEVNSPLRENGFRFYQSSFQSAPSNQRIDSLLIHAAMEGFETIVPVKIGASPVALPWGGYSLSVGKFFHDFRLDGNFQPFSASNELRNPAANVTLYQNGDSLGSNWAFGGQMGHMGSNLPVAFTIADVAGVSHNQSQYATILDVKRDKGTEIVWAGFIIMTIGLLLAYSMTQKQAWAVIIKRGDGLDELHLAAADQRDSEHFRSLWEERLAEIAPAASKPSGKSR